MSDNVFGRVYADQYDLLYRHKDYDSEIERIEEVFRLHGSGEVETVLDLGCGTGNHSLPLARRGYEVTGVDISDEMLKRAKQKAAEFTPPKDCAPPRFLRGDVRNLELDQVFDAALLMFAVLGYQLTNHEVNATLKTVRRHLKVGGIFVCDVWYGPAVLSIRPEERVNVLRTENGRLIRVTKGVLETYEHLCNVHYHLWRIRGNQVVDETEESHRMRYFFPQELALFFENAGLELLFIHPFEGAGSVPSESSWNVLVAGRAI